MHSVTRVAIVAAALTGGLLVLPGCQTSGETDQTTRTVETNRTVRASANFDRAYVAARDTEYRTSPDAAGGGRISSGTRAYFDSEPVATEGWQRARLEGGQGTVYVRPADFMRAQ